MSIDIDWEHLTTGSDGLELAESIRDFIHNKFQQVELPRFIRSVHVHSFEFGKECPVVELKDISDPLPEFYENDESSDGEEEGLDAHGNAERTPSVVTRPPDPAQNAPTAKPSYIDIRRSTLRSGLGITEQITTPFLSRSSTPGIPGGASNFGYFHLPLSGTRTPLAAVTPFTPPAWAEHHHHHYHTPPPIPTHQPPLFPQSPLKENEDRSQDLQTTLHITYHGTLSLALTAQILLDYPMTSFVGIPLKLRITGLSFDGVALLAYLHAPRNSGKMGKAQFSFLGGEDAKILIGEASHSPGRRDDGTGALKNRDDGAGGLLKEIRVESEIGGGQVLKNVGKVEKFVLEQVRRIFEEELVWPSFWTFLV